MHGYHAAKGTLPPQALHSKDGKPLLSWRVLLLPYIEQHKLFEEFNLDEPWDSPHNMQLVPKMPQVYAPFDGSSTPEPHTTFYQVFVGNGAAFERRRGLRFKDDFPDGTSNTILVVQTAAAVPWTRPVDLEYAPDQPLPKLNGLFPGTIQVGLADGGTRSIPYPMSEMKLRALITRNGGDSVIWDY
jgi:hypothetical protein